MEIFISIDGVLRNTLQKFEYHYIESFLNSDIDEQRRSMELDDNGEIIEINEVPAVIDFDYRVTYPVRNDEIRNSFTFQSDEEYENFLYIEYPVEIFGHAGISYQGVFTDLHKLMFDHPEHNFTIIGMDQFNKAKPSTLFFLSRNGFMGNNIKFVKSGKLMDVWENCDLWVTDSKQIINSCPTDKQVFKFKTIYNEHFNTPIEINKLSEIENILCTTSSENVITLT